MQFSLLKIGSYQKTFAILIFQLLDIVYREETLLNVIYAVTKNGRSILLTAVLAVILIYLFSIVGFIFFQDDFLLETDALTPVVNPGNIINCYYSICYDFLLDTNALPPVVNPGNCIHCYGICYDFLYWRQML